MELKLNTSVPLRVGKWTALIPVQSILDIAPTDKGREIHITKLVYDLGRMPDEDGVLLSAIRSHLINQANRYLSHKLTLGEIFNMAGYHPDPKDHWRLGPDALGWVNGLDQYQGFCVATNGILGITRTNDLRFILHQMSHWSKRRSRVPKDTPSVEDEQKEKDMRTKAERIADSLLLDF